MADLPEAAPPLAPEDAARLTDFARACKAAARAVLLYPPAHPAVGVTLGRITALASAAALAGPMRLTVLPNGLLLKGAAPARPDAALAELAELLHSHRVGELTVHSDGDADAWRSFLLLLGRSPESVRAEGGISRLWATMAGRHVELREIDYAEVLRERAGGQAAVWERVMANCLQGERFLADEEALRVLLELVADADSLGALVSNFGDSQAEAGGTVGAKAAALLRMLRGIAQALAEREPERLDPALRNMATAIGELSPDLMMAMLSGRGSDADETARFVGSLVGRMSETTVAHFVARNVIAEGGTPTDRLAQAFQTLVHDEEQRPRLLSLAHDDAASSPLGQTEGFEGAWNHVAEKLLTSYSDEPFVSEAYGRELLRLRAQAVGVEQIRDDPPERLGDWLKTISTTALRDLDLTLLLDLLRIEQNEERWSLLMTPVVALIEDLLLVGDFEGAHALLAVLVREASQEASSARRQHAMIALDMLAAGSMLQHLVTHLAAIDDVQFQRIQTMCVSMGEVLVRPLAEAISTEQRNRTRERLTAILIAFGAVGRRTIERLKSSANAAVRRTAIRLMREFGGSDALPELTELLDDAEPQVQREAVRAILNIATDDAYNVLRQALATGTAQSRDAIMQSISILRDERAAPLFVYILRHVDHRGPLASIYLRAIESLGLLRDPEGVAPLREALYRGEWWAPRRTATMRAAAAAALAKIGTPDAHAVLDEASHSRSRGVRGAARATVARRPRRATPEVMQ
jgi:HEAT repeat protein